MHKSYFQDLFTFLKGTQRKKIPSNSRLFIFDATSMYTTIRIGPALHQVRRFVLENEKHLDVPLAVLMDVLILLMTNNVFQFVDTYWLQTLGTSMRLPPARHWATIFFGIYEEAVLAQFRDMLQLYRCFINNILGIRLVNPKPAGVHRKWTAFVLLMQDYYRLEWIFEERLKTVNYMDMRISIRKDRIVTSLYEKLMNLYLYIPPHSAHPPGVLTGLVAGNILCIHFLCSYKKDINRRMKEFYAMLLVHSYQRDLIIPAFTKGITGTCVFIKRVSVRLCTSD